MNHKTLFGSLFLIVLLWSGFWFIGSALTGVLLLLLVVISLYSTHKSHNFQVFYLSKLMVAFLLWLIIVAYAGEIPNTSMMTLPVLAGLPIIYLVASNSTHFAGIWKVLRVVLISIAVVFAMLAIWQVVNKIGYGYAVGPLLDRNAFAALLNLLWFPMAYLFISTSFNQSKNRRWWVGAGLFIVSMALFATASRAGLAIWLLLVPILLWAGYKNTKSKPLIAATILISLLAFSCSAIFLKSNVLDRNFQIGSSSTVGELSQDTSVNARLLIWQSTVKIAQAHPLTGTGWGTFVSYYPAYRSPLENSTSGFSAHNDYLQMAAEGGIPALLLILSIVFALLIQLRKSFKRASDEEGFESLALLLGVMAIFIHASVNFIFVFAFINLLVGLYLARMSHLIDQPHIIRTPEFKQVRSSVKKLLAGSLIVIILTPFLFHLMAQVFLTGTQPGLKILNFIAPRITTYQIANFITIIYPKEYIAQQAMLQIAEQYLISNINNQAVSDNLKRQILVETISRFDAARERSANNPALGVRQVKMLLDYHELLISNEVYEKAKIILEQNLKSDPYHTKSMIMMSRLQVLKGQESDALHILEYATNHVRTRRDEQLIKVEILRQRTAPKVIPELDNVERLLNLVRSDSETGKPHILPPGFYEKINQRLNAVALQIK